MQRRLARRAAGSQLTEVVLKHKQRFDSRRQILISLSFGACLLVLPLILYFSPLGEDFRRIDHSNDWVVWCPTNAALKALLVLVGGFITVLAGWATRKLMDFQDALGLIYTIRVIFCVSLLTYPPSLLLMLLDSAHDQRGFTYILIFTCAGPIAVALSTIPTALRVHARWRRFVVRFKSCLRGAVRCCQWAEEADYADSDSSEDVSADNEWTDSTPLDSSSPARAAQRARVEFRTFLRSRRGARFFLVHCQREFSEENFLFWQTVQRFRHRPSIRELCTIVDKFVRPGAPLQLNLSAFVRDQAIRTAENLLDGLMSQHSRSPELDGSPAPPDRQQPTKPSLIANEASHRQQSIMTPQSLLAPNIAWGPTSGLAGISSPSTRNSTLNAMRNSSPITSQEHNPGTVTMDTSVSPASSAAVWMPVRVARLHPPALHTPPPPLQHSHTSGALPLRRGRSRRASHRLLLAAKDGSDESSSDSEVLPPALIVALDDAQREIEDLMFRDSFKRLQQTALWREYLDPKARPPSPLAAGYGGHSTTGGSAIGSIFSTH